MVQGGWLKESMIRNQYFGCAERSAPIHQMEVNDGQHTLYCCRTFGYGGNSVLTEGSKAGRDKQSLLRRAQNHATSPPFPTRSWSIAVPSAPITARASSKRYAPLSIR